MSTTLNLIPYEEPRKLDLQPYDPNQPQPAPSQIEGEIKPLAPQGILGRIKESLLGGVRTGETVLGQIVKGPGYSATGPTSELAGRVPLIRPEAAISAGPGIGRNVARGVLAGTGQLTTPETALMITGSGGFGAAAGGLSALTRIARSTIGRLISGGVAADMAVNLYHQGGEFKKAADVGDVDAAAKIAGEMVPTAGFAGLAARHAMRRPAAKVPTRIPPKQVFGKPGEVKLFPEAEVAPRLDLEPITKTPATGKEAITEPKLTPSGPAVPSPQPEPLEARETAMATALDKAFQEREAGMTRNRELMSELRGTTQEVGAKAEQAMGLESQLRVERRKLIQGPPEGVEERRAPQEAPTLRVSLDPRELTRAYTKYVGEPLANAGKSLLKAAIGKSGLGPYLIERYGQPAEYVEAAKGRKTAIGLGAEEYIGLGKRLTKGLTQPEQQSLGKYIKGELSEADLRKLRTDERFSDAVEAAKQARTGLDTLGGEAVMQGLLKDETFLRNYGKYMPRLYRKYEVDYDKALGQYGEKKPTRLDLDRFLRRKDIPEEVRLLMGEIKEPGYPVAKGLTQIRHDVETSKLFDYVSDHPEWTARNLEDMAARKLNPSEYTQMPETKRLGKLSGQFVQKHIAADINEIVRTRTAAEKIGRALLTEWKFGKVVLNPATHARNTMSNVMLAYLGGLPPGRVDIYARALKELKTKGPIYEEARQAGITGKTTFAGAELDALVDSWNGSRGSSLTRFVNMAQLLRQDKVSEGLKQIRPSQTKLGQKASELYQAEEQWFKLAKFMHNKEKGMNVKDAAADAQKWLFDYSEVPKFIDWARRSPFGSPFITFTYKALPAIVESGITHPWRLASLAYLLNTVVEQSEKRLQMSEEEKARVQKVLPERFKGSMAKLSPKFMLLPWKDRYNQLQYLDLTYILPWGDIGETGAAGLPSQLLSNPAFSILSDLKSGRSSFTGQEIGPPQATGAEAAKARVGHAYRQLTPSLMPGGYGFDRLKKAIEEQPDYFGRTTSVPSAVASALLGFKVNPIDVRREAFVRGKELETSMGELRTEAYRIRNNRGLSAEEKQKRLAVLREKAKRLVGQ